MSESDDKVGQFSLKTALGTATWSGKRMAELITILLLCITAVLVYAVWQHARDTERLAEQYLAAMKFTSTAIVQSSTAQREFACLISIPQEQRERAWTDGRCRRIATIGRED